MPTFTVIRDKSVIESSVFDVDPLTDTSNPFGDYCVIKMDDRGGNIFSEYPRGTRVDVEVDPDDNTLTVSSGATETTESGATDTYATVNNGGTYENAGTVEAGTGTIERFTGYSVERRENEQQGADVLEVEAYSFDQFLRRNNVTNSQLGKTIADALEDIVETDTPVAYNAANITVEDDQELTRTYQGEPVESVLRDFAFKSANEDFGVNDQLEFFFEPLESVNIARGVDNTQWFNYDIPELGKEAINEVEVWFADGDESVIVDDGTDKLDLQDSLGLPDPGTQRAELNRPLITDISDAEDEGRKYLEFRNSTLSGTVTTYGLFDAQPGDTIDVVIEPRGIDAEFVIAAVEYRWGRDETVLTIVEKRGDVDDILKELNDSVQRQEMESADRDAPKNRITTTNATGVVSVEVECDIANTALVTVDGGETLSVDSGETSTASTVNNAGTVSNQGTFETAANGTQLADGDRFVNDGRRLVRDAWAGKGISAISNLVVGDDGSGLSRSNTALANETSSVSVSQSLADAKTVEYTATVNETGVEELGLEAADGALVARAVFDNAVELQGDVTVSLTVSNDDSVSRGVLTDDGQTAVRDVLADNSPTLPNAYGYGDDGGMVAESDVALGNEIVDVSLDEILIQNADAQSQWQSITPAIAEDKPIVIDSTGPRLAQSCFTREAEDNDRNSGATLQSDADYSDGSARGLTDNGDFLEFDFTTEYTIPDGDFALFIRYETTGSVETEFFLDGTSLGTSQVDTSSTLFHEDFMGLAGFTQPGEISAGDHTLRIEVVEPGTSNPFFIFDTVAPADARYSYTLDNTNGGSSGYLDGPELYPGQIVQSLQTASTRRNVTEANFDLTANDTSGDFYVELANDGSTFTRVNNSSTGSVTFASPESGVDTNISLSRYGSRSTATPQTGYLGQSVDVWELTANPDAVVSDDIGTTETRAVVAPNTITGQTVREAGLKSDSTLLSRHILAEFALLADQRLSSAEKSKFVGDN